MTNEVHNYLGSLSTGDSVDGFYILRAAYPKTASNGKPFLNAVLSDASADMEAKVWDYAGPICEADNGKVVKIRGTVNEFRGALQITIEKIRVATEEDAYEVSNLVPVAPVDVNAALKDVEDLLQTLEDPDYKKICLILLERHREMFSKIPAAKSVHHGFLNGLLMHTGNMMKTADFLSKQYADTVNRSLLIAGTFAHDLQKQEEFTFSELGLVTEYSVKGQLIGHLVMGAQEVADLAKELGIPEAKSMLLQHMVLSHHGEPEFGAAVRPMFAEAELLSLIDLVDSRMEIYRENYAEMKPGTFSGRIFALEKKIYRHGQ